MILCPKRQILSTCTTPNCLKMYCSVCNGPHEPLTFPAFRNFPQADIALDVNLAVDPPKICEIVRVERGIADAQSAVLTDDASSDVCSESDGDSTSDFSDDWSESE